MDELLGTGEQLSPYHMAVRALITFFVALILIRTGGLRIVGKKSGFDLVIVIMMGAVMARGIVGASPMFSTIVAASVMIAINMLLAWLCIKSPLLNKIFKGSALILYQNGKINWKNMEKASLSESDLLTSLRLETHEQSLEKVTQATLETNGRISFLLKP
ncbi:DUF421 domain-containing protein [Pedobacter gandavensis]|uniref:DUF421 domain-containing protein n=1 Tax=Pedobacter gandavensis TaxID=2679963 RepID=UPI00247A0E11|nr:YetF domain-containing protein [Pedobacter gandavensis]WGQ10684.1 DUF421 domain-containing protein [Pedobacter gandavensis]